MPSGRLAAVDLTANTDNTAYLSTGVASITCSLCNRTSAAITVRVALSATATPSAGEWIEYGAPIPANGVLERTGLVLSSGQYLVVNPSASGVSAVVFGFLE